jgi:hypothetical protein
MARISRAIPLDQLRQPETDVRERRPEDSVKSLAASMGDPNVGQLQDILVHPVGADLEDPPATEEDLDDLFTSGHPMRVVDGETRRLAAQHLGWATIDATIVPEPPEDTTIAQLDANTERIEMGQAETVRALYQHYEETGATLEDMGDKTGFSASYLSQVFGLMESPEWLQEAWRHPDHPLETGHALAVMSMLSSNSIERYAEAGNMTEEAARERCVEDAQLMIDVQGQHDLQVGDFRQRVKRCQSETLDEIRDNRTRREKQADGETSTAEREVDHYEQGDHNQMTCMVCGDAGDRKIALDVCQDDYGMLSSMKANDEVLMAQADTQTVPSETPEAPAEGDNDPAEALAAATGISTEEAQQVIQEVRKQSQAGPQP